MDGFPFGSFKFSNIITKFNGVLTVPQCNTGINENKTVYFGAYPNPFINEIKFDGYEKIEIFNVGVQLIQTILTGKWNARGYANGVYFCKGYVRKDDTEFKGFMITKLK